MRFVRTVWEGMLDLVYPSRCQVCEQYDQPVLCAACAERFAPIPTPMCLVCGRPVEGVLPCRLCVEQAEGGGWAFEEARACGIYEGGLRQAIHRLKYGEVEALGLPLGEFLAVRAVVEGLLSGEARTVEAVVPLPMHPAKQRQRGFNQTVVLAKPLAEMLGVPLQEQTVIRRKRVPAQVGLSPRVRRQNVREVFAVPKPEVVAGRSFLLVDDVFTTGATVNACASVLKEAGASAVYVITLAAGG